MVWTEQTILLVMHEKGQSPAALSMAHLLCWVNGSLKEEGMLFFLSHQHKKVLEWVPKKKKKVLPVFNNRLFTAPFLSKATLQHTRLARIKYHVYLIFLRAGRQPSAEEQQFSPRTWVVLLMYRRMMSLMLLFFSVWKYTVAVDFSFK